MGILLDTFKKERVELLQISIYLLVGWLVVVEFDNLKLSLSNEGINWLIAGGLAYTLGVTFYVLDNMNWLRHAHGIWHLFVLLGSITHFVSILVYVR